jgi:hypothetical protein
MMSGLLFPLRFGPDMEKLDRCISLGSVPRILLFKFCVPSRQT